MATSEATRALEAERDAYHDRCDALESLLACYRAGTRPSEKLHRRLAATKAALAKGAPDDTATAGAATGDGDGD